MKRHTHRPVRMEQLETRLCLSVNFSTPLQTPLGPATLMAWGDFNGDGQADLIVKGASTSTTTANIVRMHAGLGNGRFATTGVPTWSGPNVSSILVGDFNRDGKLDLAFTNDQAYGSITFGFGRGDGTFGGLGAATVIPQSFVGANPKGVTAGDFNGDGKLDLLVANGGAWRAPGSTQPETYGPGLLLGNGDGTFLPVIKLFNSGEPHEWVASGDINNDGHLDVALVGPDLQSLSPVPGTALYTLLGDGTGGFSVTRTRFVIYAVRGLTLGDLNGDGRADLGALQVFPSATDPNGPATLYTYTATSAGGFAYRSSIPTKISRAAGLSAADFDRDGKLDFAVAGISPTTTSVVAPGFVSVLRGVGDGTVEPARQFATHGPPLAQLVADFNGDARLDIVTGGPVGVSTLLNRPATNALSDQVGLQKSLVELIGLTE